MMEARDSSHQLELHMQAFYEHIRAGTGGFPLHQPSPLQQQQQQQQHSSPYHPHHHYHHHHQQQQPQQQHQQPAHHHLQHLHHLHPYQQQQQEQQLQETASRNSFNPSIIHSPSPLRQMSPSPNFNLGPGPNHNPSPNPGSNINPSSSSGMSACYPPETPPHMIPHQVQTGSPPSGIGVSTSPGSAMVPRPASVFKKKRGRPRKYATDVNGAALVIPLTSVAAGEKRGGGRGPSKKTQSSTSGVTGQGFTPHVLTVGAGEDVTAKIMTFSQHGPWAVCILSANGAISNASLLHAGISSSTVTYEGRFEILSLSGLFLLTDDGATRTRSGGFSVSLAGQDGRVIGGRVAGLLIAATPVQVVVGTFFPEGRKTQAKAGNPEGSFSSPPTREPPMQILDKVHVDTTEPVQDYVPEPPEGLHREQHCTSNAMPLADWRASEYNEKLH